MRAQLAPPLCQATKSPSYTATLPTQLKRYYGKDYLHFITFSCYRRFPYLGTAAACEIMLCTLVSLWRSGVGDNRTLTGLVNRMDNLNNTGCCASSHPFANPAKGCGTHCVAFNKRVGHPPEGNRVAKGTLSSFSCGATFTPTNTYILGPSGEQLTETDGSGNWVHTNVYAAGQYIATYENDTNSDSNVLHFVLTDWLGTKRVQTNYAGVSEEVCTSLAFGDGLSCSYPTGHPSTADDASEIHFTGKERDTESGNDYFVARYYGSSMGRMMSPDPWLGSMHMDNPQSLNRYAYVLNNPLKYIDPDGLDCAYLNDAGTDIEKGGLDQTSNSRECKKHGGYWVVGAIADVSSSGNNITFNVIGADLNRYNATFNTNSPIQPVALSMDLDSYFGNYALAQRQAVMNRMNATPTPQQYIQAIALAAPTVCGGGVFGVAGGEVSGAVLHGAVGVITQVDSRSGVSSGLIVEAGGGEGLIGGGGAVRGADGVEGFGYEGAGVDVGGAGGSAGAVAFSSGGVGVYADGQFRGRMAGVGAYVNITNNATCLGRR